MKKLSKEEEKKNRLKDLIELALDRYRIDEIVEEFNFVTRENYVPELPAMESEDMVKHLAAEGYCIFKTNSLIQETRLREYAEKHVFRYLNEQEVAILF